MASPEPDVCQKYRSVRDLLDVLHGNAADYTTRSRAALDEYRSYSDEGAALASLRRVAYSDGTVTETVSTRKPKLQTNMLYPAVNDTVASIVPSDPAVDPISRVPFDPMPEHPRIVAKMARRALVSDQFIRDDFVGTLRRAVRLSSVHPNSVLYFWFDLIEKRARFEALSPRNAWFDPTVQRHEDARYFVRARAIRKDELAKMAQSLEGVKEEGYWIPEDVVARCTDEFAGDTSFPEILRPMDGDIQQTDTDESFEWVTVYDYFDFVNGRVQKWVRGQDTPILDAPLPYKFVKRPFFVITLNDNLENAQGISDYALIRNALKQMHEAETITLHGGRSQIRMLLYKKAGLTKPDEFEAAYAKAGAMAALGVDGEVDLERDFKWSSSPSQSPQVGEIIQRAERAIRSTLASPEYRRGAVGQSKNATEVALADAAVKSAAMPRAEVILRAVRWAAGCIVGAFCELLPDGVELRARQKAAETTNGMPITRETLGLPPFRYVEQEDFSYGLEVPAWEDDFDYEPVPNSGDEAARFALLRLLEQWYPLLAQNPSVDMPRLTRKILDLLRVLDIYKEGGAMDGLAAMQGMAPPGQEGAAPLEGGLPPGLPGMPGEDTISTGALPLGAPPVDAGVTDLGGPGHPAPLK